MPDMIQLDEMSRVEIACMDRSALVDIKTIQIDTSLPITKRMVRYLAQIKNPYCFRCGQTPVRIRFSDTGKTLDEAIKDHFIGLKTL